MTAMQTAYFKLVTALAVVAGAILTAITVALIVNVAVRVAGAGGLFGMVDAIELGLMASTFLAAPWVLMKNGHVVVDIALMAMPPRTQRKVNLATMLLGAAMSLVLTWSSASALSISLERGSMIRGVLVLPEWIPLIAPTIAGLLLALEFLRRAFAGPLVKRQQPGL